MASISGITTALKKFSGKPLAVTSKVLGAATAAAVLYDAHSLGREKAIVTDDIESADRFIDQYNNYIMSDKESATVAKLKKGWFDMQQSFSFFHPVSKAKGYVAGFGKTLCTELPAVALSVTALASKSWIGKTAGVLLAGNAIKTLVCDVMGVGSTKPRKS